MPTARFGGRRASATKIARKAVVAGESAPTEKLHGLKVTEYYQCEWGISKPAGVTSYATSFYGYREVLGVNDLVLYAEWYLIETVTGLTESSLYYQYVDEQRIQCTIHDIVVGGGGIGDGFTVIYTGIGRS